jgi:hypothetical protein
MTRGYDEGLYGVCTRYQFQRRPRIETNAPWRVRHSGVRLSRSLNWISGKKDK